MKPNENEQPTAEANAEATTDSAADVTETEANPDEGSSQPEEAAGGEPVAAATDKPKAKKRRSKKRKAKAAAKSSPAEPKALTSAGAEKVSLGPVEGRLQRVAKGIVYGILGPAMAERVELLRNEHSIDHVRQRMLATDGRATPVVFAAGRDKNEPPSLLSGVEAVAASLDSDIDELSVIIVAPGDVGEVQSHLVEMARKLQEPTETEDDLYYRVMADADD